MFGLQSCLTIYGLLEWSRYDGGWERRQVLASDFLDVTSFGIPQRLTFDALYLYLNIAQCIKSFSEVLRSSVLFLWPCLAISNLQFSLCL